LNGGRLPETSNCYCHPGKAGGLPLCAKTRSGEGVGSYLLNELARAIVSEARTRFSDDPALAEVWRVAAHEAACAQLSAVEWQGP